MLSVCWKKMCDKTDTISKVRYLETTYLAVRRAFTCILCYSL